MNRSLLATCLLMLGFGPTPMLAAYSYYYSDDLTVLYAGNWAQNGTVSFTSSGLTASSTDGGSLISAIAVPDDTSDYEVMTTLNPTASGGTFVTYLRAST